MSKVQTKFSSRLHGAKVIMFGGSSGIGYAVAEAVVESGATVVVSSSSKPKLEAAVESLRKAYPSAHDRISGYAIDLSNESTVEADVTALFKAVGKVNHVAYLAGDALAMSPIQDVQLDLAKKAGQVRFFSPLIVAKYAARNIVQEPSSSITFTAGIVADRPIPGWPLVSAYASAMHGLARALAVDLKPIRVNVVQPGVVDTGIYAASGIPDEVKKGILADTASKLPIGKVSSPGDVAESYIYLMRTEAATGEIINANGGNLLV